MLLYYVAVTLWKINNAPLSGMLNVTKSDKNKRAVTSVLLTFAIYYILYVTLSFPVLDTARGRQPYQYIFFVHPSFGPTVSLLTIIET